MEGNNTKLWSWNPLFDIHKYLLGARKPIKVFANNLPLPVESFQIQLTG